MGERQSDFCHLEILNLPLLSFFPPQDWYLWGLTEGPLPSSPRVSFFPTPRVSSALFVHCVWVDSFFFFQSKIIFEDANWGYARSLQSAFLCLHFLPLTFAFRLITSFPVPFPHGSSSNKAVRSFPSWGGNHLLAQVAAESRCLKQWVEHTTFHGHACLSLRRLASCQSTCSSEVMFVEGLNCLCHLYIHSVTMCRWLLLPGSVLGSKAWTVTLVVTRLQGV